MVKVMLWLTAWSPYIWMFFSTLGLMVAAEDVRRIHRVRQKARADGDAELANVAHFLAVQTTILSSLLMGFSGIGLLSLISHATQSLWGGLFTLVVLVLTPAVIVLLKYRDMRFRTVG